MLLLSHVGSNVSLNETFWNFITVATRRHSHDYIGKSSNQSEYLHKNYKIIARLYFTEISKVFKHSRFYCFNKRHSSVESFLKHLLRV